MLVFAHPTEPYVGPAGTTVDPHGQVEQRVASFFGVEAGGITTLVEDARTLVPRGAGLVVVPDIADVECSPAQASMTWAGALEEVRFLLRAGAHREGTTVEGWVRVFCGALVIAEVAVEFAVVGDGAAPAPLSERGTVSYRRIFPCFSPRDVHLVAGFAAVAAALGDRFPADVIAGRTDDAPDEWMLPLIEEADVFQLFWSNHSMHSSSCRRQWEAALATGRSGFIRPLYWEHPFPRAPGLPPPVLERLQFIRVPAWTGAGTATEELWRAAPTTRPAPAGSSSSHAAPGPDRVYREESRRSGGWWGGGGLAAVVGLFAAAVAVGTLTLSGGPGTPTIDPGPDGGVSTLALVAVGVVAFVVAFVLVFAVLRWRRGRTRGSRRRRRTASSGR
jgi:hypothetical protein